MFFNENLYACNFYPEKKCKGFLRVCYACVACCQKVTKNDGVEPIVKEKVKSKNPTSKIIFHINQLIFVGKCILKIDNCRNIKSFKFFTLSAGKTLNM